MVESIAVALRRLLGSPGFKFFLICALILILTIPLLLVWALIEERQQRAESVRGDVAREWGAAQSIIGPVLIVPYTVRRMTAQGEKQVEELVERHAVFMPQVLSVDGKAPTKVLHRSIYDVAVYTATLDFEGSFAAPDMSEVAADVQAVRWRDAILALAINDVSGLKSTVSALIDGATKLAFEPSIGIPDDRLNGIHVRLASDQDLFGAMAPAAQLTSMHGFTFKFALTLNGSSELTFAPVARETTVALSSDWPSPSFTGAFLPTDRALSKTTFSARWQVPHLARSVPQAWSLSDQTLARLSPYQFGVRFIVPVDFYQVVARAAKYALMLLATAFMAVFVLELRSARSVHRPVHPVQYMFVGLALVLFYVLLLSFAEQTGFLLAYLIAAGATVGLISLYVGRVQGSFLKGLIVALVLAVLYALLYLILQMEDYALLAGAIGAFVMLAALMFGTLRVNWSGEDARSD